MSRATIAAGAAVTALVGAGLLFAPGHLLGAPGGEVWGHAWVQWWHSEAWPQWPAGPEHWLVGSRDWPVIDPLPTFLAAAVGRLTGPITAYNFTVLVGVFVAFLGGAALARRHRGDPIVGGLALALAPSFLGSVASGLTEDLAVGLAALALGFVGRPGWRAGLLSGLCLGVVASCGLVLAWAVGLCAVGLGIAALVLDGKRREVVVSLGVGAAVSGALAVPLAWLQGARLGGEGHRTGDFVARVEPLWRLNPWRGADLASFVVPGPVDPGDALVRMHPGYLGLSLLALAVAAGWSRWWWVLAAAVCVAPGPDLSFAGSPTGLSNPAAAVLQLVPGGSLINHHGRLLLVAAVALSVLASVGATRVPRRLRVAVIALVLVDLAFLSPVGAPLPTADAAPLAVAADPALDALPDGPVLQLPAAGPGVHFQRPLLDQRAHRRPLLLDPNRPGLPRSLVKTPTGRFLSQLAMPRAPEVPATADWPDGVGVLLVAEPYVAAVTALFGPPDVQAADSAAWGRPAVP